MEKIEEVKFDNSKEKSINDTQRNSIRSVYLEKTVDNKDNHDQNIPKTQKTGIYKYK